ncbi:MAG: hypothetical protein NTU54_03315 [Candidatus Omnitrophica bacterium]|nr:hypothetical protein [Candidatus Omnitrophota bacterium]
MRLILFGQTKEVSNTLMYSIAAGVAILFVYFIFYAPLAKEIKKKSREYKSLEAKLQEARNTIESLRNKGVSSSKAELSGRLELRGVFLDKKVPLAIINDKVVAVGDKIGRNAVTDIKEDVVVLNDGSKDFELRLNQ